MTAPRHQPAEPGQPAGQRFLSGRPRPARRAESDGYAAAEQLQAQRPQWMIMYGCYSRRFWAFPLFHVTRSIVVHAAYQGALIDRLDRAEHAYRARPPQDKPRP